MEFALASGIGVLVAAGVYLLLRARTFDVILGLTLLVFVFVPRATITVGWTAVGLAAVLGVFGPILQFPEWVVDLSPFAHSPVVAGGDTDWTGGFWMLAIGITAAGAAVWSMRRRELASGG